MSAAMMPAGSGQIPARRRADDEPLLILGFTYEDKALCNLPDGGLEWVDFAELTTSWRWDRDNEVWYSDVITLEDLALAEEEEQPEVDPGPVDTGE